MFVDGIAIIYSLWSINLYSSFTVQIPWAMYSVVLWCMSNDVLKWFAAVSENAPASVIVCFDCEQ